MKIPEIGIFTQSQSLKPLLGLVYLCNNAILMPKKSLAYSITPFGPIRPIKEELGAEVKHAVIPCLGNPIEQSHREIKQRYYPTLGFGSIESAKRFCQAYDEVRQFFRPRQRMAEFVSLSDRREHFLQ